MWVCLFPQLHTDLTLKCNCYSSLTLRETIKSTPITPIYKLSTKLCPWQTELTFFSPLNKETKMHHFVCVCFYTEDIGCRSICSHKINVCEGSTIPIRTYATKRETIIAKCFITIFFILLGFSNYVTLFSHQLESTKKDRTTYFSLTAKK